MAISATNMTEMKHRQLLYAVSTRLSRENLKDMMYLAVIDKELQQSVQSGTDLFTILEHKGLLSHENYTHLISILETIGRIDLIETVFSGHQTKAAMFFSSACTFSVPEQLAYMKRVQILRKRERYLHCVQKLDGLVNNNTFHQHEFEVYFLQLLSELQTPEIDPSHLPLQYFTQQRVCKLLSSFSLYSKSGLEGCAKARYTGDIKAWECFETQSNQCCKEFCAELPEEKQLVLQLSPNIYGRENTIGIITRDAYQSLHDVFEELFGKKDCLVVADASLNNAVLKLESFDKMTLHAFPMFKWLLALLFAIENGLVNIEDIKDVVMVIVSSHREGIVQTAEEVENIVGQDTLKKLLHLIPNAKPSPTEAVNSEIPEVIQSTTGKPFYLVWYTCLTLLACFTLLSGQEREQLSLKSVLPELRKSLVYVINTKHKNKNNMYMYMIELMVSNIHKETQLYKKECEQVVLKLTGGSQKSADNFRSLFDLPF